MLNIKIDSSLKKEAQELAKSFGLPLSTIISRKLKEFVEEREIKFKENECQMNKKTQKEILKRSEEVKKIGYENFETFETAEDAIKHLKSL